MPDFEKIKEEGSEKENLLIYYDKNCKEYFPNSFDEDNQVIEKPKDQSADSVDKSVIAECIYSSRFLSEKEAERLVHTVTEGLEDWEKDLIDDDAWTVDRIKTKNLETFVPPILMLALELYVLVNSAVAGLTTLTSSVVSSVTTTTFPSASRSWR